MRILHVLAPAPYGGLEQVVCDLARGLAHVGADVHVAAIVTTAEPAADHPFIHAIRNTGVHVHPVYISGRAYLKERAALRALYAQLRPDVVHTHGYRADVIAGAAARAFHIPTVSTAHGFTGGDFRNRCYETLQRRAFRSCSAVIAVSRPLRDQLSNPRIAGSRVNLIQNAWGGARDFMTRTAARSALGIPDNVRAIGWIGRLSHEKAPDVLLEALPQLPSDCEVTFIGDGPMRPALEQRADALDVRNRVRFAGRIADAARLIPAFDVFALSSRTEGTPIVLLEAMAAGVPIVATQVGGVPDVVDETSAWLTPSEQPAGLANAITAVLADPAASARRSDAASRQLQSRFSVKDWIAKHLELYHHVRHQIEAA